MTKKDWLQKRIDKIITSAGKVNDYIHETACMVMEHAFNHGDCTGAARLIEAMPKSHKANLLVTWFDTYSPIFIRKKDNVLVASFRKQTSPHYKPFNLEGARSVPFWDIAKPEGESKPYVFFDLLQNFVKRAEKQLKDKGSINELEALTKLKLILQSKDVLPSETVSKKPKKTKVTTSNEADAAKAAVELFDVATKKAA